MNRYHQLPHHVKKADLERYPFGVFVLLEYTLSLLLGVVS